MGGEKGRKKRKGKEKKDLSKLPSVSNSRKRDEKKGREGGGKKRRKRGEDLSVTFF